MDNETAELIDQQVAARIRARRMDQGITLQALARQIGVAFQQVHKYETGMSRISAGRLYHVAGALSVPIGFFFAAGDSPAPDEPAGMARPASATRAARDATRQTVSVMRNGRSAKSRQSDDGQERPQRMVTLGSLLRRLGHDKRGAIAAIFAVLVPVLVTIVGFGVETGIWYTVKRHNQSIADVAALSGALELAGGGSCASGWPSCTSAQTDAKTNGFDVTDPTNTASTLTVTSPGGIQTVTATLKHQQTPLIVGYLMGTAPFTIFDQAVAQVQKIFSCITGVAPTGITLHMSGSPTLTMPGCTITSDSTDVNSVKTNGSPTADAYSIITAGGVNGSCTNITGLALPPECGATPPADPYAAVNVATSPANLTTFAIPTLPATATTFPTATSIATTTTKPASLGGTAPGSGTGGSGCLATTTISTTQTVSSSTCYTNALIIQSPATVTFGNGTAETFHFNKGLTVNSGAKVIFQTGGNTVSVTGGFTINGGATFNPGKYGFSTGVTTGSTSTLTFNAGGAYNITNGAAFQISGAATFANGSSTTYEFYSNGLTINSGGVATFSGTDALPASLDLNAGNLSVAGTLNLNPGSYYLAAGSLTSTGTVNFQGADSSSKYALSASSFSLGGPVTFGATAPAGIAFYTGAVTLNSGSAISFPATNYCFAGGALTINRNVSFLSPGLGTATINVPTGGITTASGTTLTFNDSSGSKYIINTGANAITLGGTSSFGTGTYFFTNYAQANCTGNVAASAGTGVAVNGNASFGGGVYSIQKAPLTIAAGTTSTFASGTTCAATPAGSCLYLANGALTNAGTATFANGTFYLYEPGASGSITNSGTLTLGSGTSNVFYINNPIGAFSNSGTVTLASGTYYVWDGTGGFTDTGALTFTGGSSSNYYFFNPSGGGNTALNINSGNVAFGPATYYVVNGNLNIAGAATVTCPTCAVGGAGDTFVLTGTGSGNTLTGNIGTVSISGPTLTLNAPDTGTYAGLLIFQDRNAGTFTFNGNSSVCKSGNCNTLTGGTNTDLTGMIYLPAGAIAYQGGKSSGNCLVVTTAEVSLSGSAFLNSDGCTLAGVNAPFINHVALTQ